MVFRTTLIFLHSCQVFLSAFCFAASAAIQIKVSTDGYYVNHTASGDPTVGRQRSSAFYLVFGAAVTSLLAAVALLLGRYFTQQQSRAIHIATLSVSAVWTVFWMAALIRYVVVENLQAANWDLNYYYDPKEEQKLYIISTVEWAVGVLLALLWLATTVLAAFGIVLHTRTAKAGRTRIQQPPAYEDFQYPNHPIKEPQQTSPHDFITLDRVL